jgi:hypothetical protein
VSPATTAAVTIAVAGTAPQADETPSLATETPRQAVQMKRAIKKKICTVSLPLVALQKI